MSVDLSKLITNSPNNSFKNDGTIYTGTIAFPTSCASGTSATSTYSFTLNDTPQFSKFFAYFRETTDAITAYVGGSSNGTLWYDQNTAVNQGVGITVTSPAPSAGVISASLYPIINGNTITITAEVWNPYSSTISISPLSVPFAFIEYTLAN